MPSENIHIRKFINKKILMKNPKNKNFWIKIIEHLLINAQIHLESNNEQIIV